tara:strand:+ start:6345 stop:7235 length:891 start_codon:yes stop_codon:yes gene_type:complete
MALAKLPPSDHYDISFDQGSYQFITLKDIINNFIVSQIGDDKIIKKAKRAEVLYHAQRGIAELNYDTLGNIRTQEIDLGPSLSMPIPHDYVNIVDISFVDRQGILRQIAENKLSDLPEMIYQDFDYSYLFGGQGELLISSDSVTAERFREGTDNQVSANDSVDSLEEGYGYNVDYGKRYGLDPTIATKNGAYIISDKFGVISFSSNLANQTIVLRYISDGLHNDEDMRVHKFAEEAMYKIISYGIMSSKSNIPEYQINRVKKERRAAIRNAKIRLAKLSPSEIIQALRGKSKQIKH